MKRLGPFWSYVRKGDGCWEWTGARNTRGYGTYSARLAHRVAYAEARGAIPDGMYVCHHCDNPPCVRPDHLFLGTPTDNVRDMIAKGRVPRRNMPRGEDNPNALLTEGLVLTIIRRYRAGESPRVIAADIGLKFRTVESIAHGERWRHLQPKESGR